MAVLGPDEDKRCCSSTSFARFTMPDSIDDSAASEEWGWKPSYDLEKMSDDMLENLKRKLG